MRSVSLICGVVISSAVGAIDLPNIDHYPATPETIQQCVKDYNTKKELKSTFFDFLTNESDLKKVNQWCKEMRELFSACRYGKGGPSAGYICRWLKAGARDILNYAVSKTIKPTFILSSAHNACLENLNERCSVFEELLKHETISEKLSTALQRRVTLNKSTALAQKFNKCRQSALNAKRTSKDQALKKVANALMSTCSALFKLIHANNITKIDQLRPYEQFKQYLELRKQFKTLKAGSVLPEKMMTTKPIPKSEPPSELKTDEEEILEEEYNKLMAEDALKKPSLPTSSPSKSKEDEQLEEELEQLMREEGLEAKIPPPILSVDASEEDKELEAELEQLMKEDDEKSTVE